MTITEPLEIVLHNADEEGDLRIPTTYAEFFEYGVCGYNNELEHFTIDMEQSGDFTWQGKQWDFCAVYSQAPTQEAS